MKFLVRAVSLLPRWSHQTTIRCMSSPAASFKAKDVELQLCSPSEMKAKPDPDNLVFGAEFSDHMLEVEWTLAGGWGRPLISRVHNLDLHPAAKVFHYAVEVEWTSAGGWGRPLISRVHNLDLHPAAKVFHYAVELFEGMKAYRGIDDKVRLFRPDQNMKRMLSTTERSALPPFDGGELTKLIKKLVSVDQEWVPYSTTSTLYIRPTFIGTEASIGVTKTQRALLYVLTGPVGPYYPTGFKPVTLLADPKYVRAWEGGCGAYKMGANYAPTIQIQIEALEKHGCQQVLWLYGPDQQITEVGTMNIFLYWKNQQGETELITPPLTSGTILPGVTRRSLIDLANQWGEFKMTERTVTMKELVQGLKENRVLELFGAGTACVVCPVEKIIYEGSTLEIPTMKDGAPLTMRMYKELTDIQFGRTPSDWAVQVQ